MAGKVNTRFVLVAATVAIALAGAAFIVGKRALAKSASDHAELGDAAAASGDWPKAAVHYSQAVNKDQKNVERLKKWINALEQLTPETKQQYVEFYLQQYFGGALKGLSDADVGSYESQKKYLDEWYRRARRQGADLAGWEAVANTCDEVLRRFNGDDQNRKKLTRYRALARAQAMALKPQRTPDEMKAARDDVAAALEAVPGDEDVFLAGLALDALDMQKLRDAQEGAKADELVRAMKQRCEAFVAANPPAAQVQLRTYLIELGELSRSAPQGTTLKSLIEESLLTTLTKTVEAFEKVPADKVEGRALITLSMSGSEAIESLGKRVRTMLEAAAKAQPNDTKLQLEYGELLLNMGKVEEAVALWESVAKMPMPKLSLLGIELLDDQPRAVVAQAEAMFAGWQQTQDMAKREDYAKRAKAYRDAFAALTSQDNLRIGSLDARLRFLAGDISQARTLISKYNDQTERRDAMSVLFEAEIMRSLGNRGAAKTAYQRTLELQPRNVRAMMGLGQVLQEEGDIPQALGYLSAASSMMPNDEGLRTVVENLRKLTDTKDPVTRKIMSAQERISGVNRDVAGAEAILEAAARDFKDDPRIMYAWARLRMADNRRDQAMALVDRGLARDPNNVQLKSLKTDAAAGDPLEARLAQIDGMLLTPVQKATQKYVLCLQAGQPERAKTFLAEAEKLGPEEPTVVEALFVDAASRRDLAKIDALVKIAEAKNLDGLGGLQFRARRDIVEAQRLRDQAMDKAKTDEAAAQVLMAQALDVLKNSRVALRQVTVNDKSNTVAHRLLGVVELELGDQGDLANAVKAFSDALELKPDDVQSITGKLRAMQRSGQMAEALEFARKAEKLAGKDEDFRQQWLALESTAPNGDRSRALLVRQDLAKREPDNVQNQIALAYLLMEQRKWDDARKVIDEVRGKGRVIESVEMMANWNYRQGDFDKTAKVYQDYIDSLPPENRTLSVYLQAARSMRNLGRITESLQFFTEARQFQDKKDVEVDREIGDTLYTVGRVPEALQVYKSVLEAGFPDPGDLVRARLIEGYLGVGDIAGAQTVLDQVGTRANNSSTLLMLSARVAMGQNDRPKAKRLLDQAVAAAGPTDPFALMSRAQFNAVDPQLIRDVEQDLKEALRRQPMFAAARRMLAEVYFGQGNVDGAIGQLRDGVNIDPGNDQLRMLYIQTLLNLNRGDEALLAADEALKKRPEDLTWMLQISQLNTQLGKHDRAIELGQQAFDKTPEAVTAGVLIKAILAKEPPDITRALKVTQKAELGTEKDISMLLLRARVHVAAKKADLALADMKKAAGMLDRNNPENIQGFFTFVNEVYPNKKDASVLMDRLEEVAVFEGWMKFFASGVRVEEQTAKSKGVADLTALTSHPDKVLQFAANGLLGIQAYKERDLEKAISFYKKCLEINPNDPEMNNNLAYVIGIEQGKTKEAEEYALRAVSVQPNNPLILDTLGAILVEAGRIEDAEKVLIRALNLARDDRTRFPIILNWGLLQLKKGNKSEASKALDGLKQLIAKDESLLGEHAGRMRTLEDGVKQ